MVHIISPTRYRKPPWPRLEDSGPIANADVDADVNTTVNANINADVDTNANVDARANASTRVSVRRRRHRRRATIIDTHRILPESTGLGALRILGAYRARRAVTTARGVFGLRGRIVFQDFKQISSR